MSRQAFEAAVTEALAEVPAAFRPYLENVAVDVEQRPDAELLRELEMEDGTELLGVYLGTPLTERSIEFDAALPDRIVIFQENIEAVCETRAELVEEIRCTVLHEVGHHFGLDEDELEDLGYG